MSPELAFVLGAAAGLAIATLLIRPGNCCERISEAARERVGEELGPWAVAVGDTFNVWKLVPGIANAAGV